MINLDVLFFVPRGGPRKDPITLRFGVIWAGAMPVLRPGPPLTVLGNLGRALRCYDVAGGFIKCFLRLQRVLRGAGGSRWVSMGRRILTILGSEGVPPAPRAVLRPAPAAQRDLRAQDWASFSQ